MSELLIRFSQESIKTEPLRSSALYMKRKKKGKLYNLWT